MKNLKQYIIESRKFKQDNKGVEFVYIIGTDDINKRANALNRVFTDFNSFVESLSVYYNTDIPKIQKKTFLGHKNTEYVVFYMYTKEKWDNSGKHKELRYKIECADINGGPVIKFTIINKDSKTGELIEHPYSEVSGYKWDLSHSSTQELNNYWSWFRLKGGERVGWTLIP